MKTAHFVTFTLVLTTKVSVKSSQMGGLDVMEYQQTVTSMQRVYLYELYSAAYLDAIWIK